MFEQATRCSRKHLQQVFLREASCGNLAGSNPRSREKAHKQHTQQKRTALLACTQKPDTSNALFQQPTSAVRASFITELAETIALPNAAQAVSPCSPLRFARLRMPMAEEFFPNFEDSGELNKVWSGLWYMARELTWSCLDNKACRCRK